MGSLKSNLNYEQRGNKKTSKENKMPKIIKQNPKLKSPPLTSKEIADVKAALKEKRRRIFKTPEEAIVDLHKFVANS